MARSTGTKPRAAPARKAPTDVDRDARALDNAARRVPVWQVSIVAAILRLSEHGAVDGERLKLVLEQVPSAVLRAAEMHRAGRWRRL